ncbi:hypothetical protein BROUX41_002937 [Berkeleyomyces rouxiae]
MASQPAPSAVPAALNILPSNQAAVISSPTSAPSQHMAGPPPGRQSLSSRTSWQSLHGGNADLNISGPVPIRHPRPMTAAQLHSELEQENEAVVNRLTRELSLLRAAQNASVISNTSSTSAHGDCIIDPHAHPLASPVHPIPISPVASRRHQRATSNASLRSQTAGSFSASYEARRGAAIPLSRQGSSASRRSRNNSPGPHTMGPADSTLAYLQQQRNPVPTSAPMPMMGATGSLPDQVSPALLPVTPRYEETAFYRAELESAKRENDALKRRIRELERMVRSRRPSDASRPRSESVSTTASIAPAIGSGIGVAPPRETAHAHAHHAHATSTAAPLSAATPVSTVSQLPVSPRPTPVRQASATGSIAVGVPEEEVKVGESATSAGLS